MAAGSRTGTITIEDNGYFSDSTVISLSGTGSAIAVTGSPFNFGSQAVKTTTEKAKAEVAEANGDSPQQSATGRIASPDGPITVGIDGGYVRAAHKEGVFEVIAGRSVVAFRREADDETPEAKCFGYVQTYLRAETKAISTLSGKAFDAAARAAMAASNDDCAFLARSLVSVSSVDAWLAITRALSSSFANCARLLRSPTTASTPSFAISFANASRSTSQSATRAAFARREASRKSSRASASPPICVRGVSISASAALIAASRSRSSVTQNDFEPGDGATEPLSRGFRLSGMEKRESRCRAAVFNISP